ncbi:SPOR domain-containing protein [Roseovarius arcticus]|uniref:SPOR domain-containing protein n=1 Tax=Roseovarius arcticus TaxID=2547404 RepID=UPI0011107480|nr:SPOR domain-containing protein [Roseovarius arcticus]
MKLTRLIALAVIAASCGLGIAQAKSLRDSGTPAEFPPSSYTGRQYVDSEGCVYVRAGIDGNVTWVPRVSRARKTMCGQQPSLTARAPAATPKPQPQIAPQPKAKISAVPAPAPKRVVRAKPAPAQPALKVRVRKVAVPVPRPAPVLAPVAKPAKQPVRRKTRVAVAPVCPGASALSSRYTANAEGYAVRCGPQKAPHVTRVPGTHAARSAPRAMPAPSYEAPAYSVPAPAAVLAYVVRTAPTVPQGRKVRRVVRVDPYTVRVAPRHVAQQQARATQEVVIPEGYKRVWMDGRLNPNRANQTFAGKAQMDMMWTQTQPRRLILTDTGREMSAQYPGLVYPYTSYEQQRAAMAAPKRRGTVSTKSRQPAAQAIGQNYVQAGVFTTRAQALQAAQRLNGVGLPARLGSMTQGGTKYSLLLSGPYANAQSAQSALARVRSAGFGNARLR